MLLIQIKENSVHECGDSLRTPKELATPLFFKSNVTNMTTVQNFEVMFGIFNVYGTCTL